MNIVRRISTNLFSTFRGRLAMLYIVVELSVLLFAGVLLYIVLSQQVYRSVDEQLQEQAQQMAHQLENSSFRFWSQNLSQFSLHFRGTVMLISANGNLLFGPKSPKFEQSRHRNSVSKALRRAMDAQVIAFASTSSLLRENNSRIIVMPVHRAGHVVAALMLERDMDEIHQFFELMYIVGAILGLLSMLISGYAGYVMARRALKPINEIHKVARKVAAGDLSTRLTSFSQDHEIKDLIDTLNTMFKDLDTSFSSQKRFTADASHELRIPLTVMKGEIEVALRHKREPHDYELILRQQLDMIDRMQRIVDGLLMLARADAGQLELAEDPVDLSLLLQEVFQHHLILYESKSIHLDLQISDDLQVMGDTTHLESVLFNLLNNAFKHAPEKSTVTLHARSENSKAVVEVCDQGPGISMEDQAHLFDRFYRADSARNSREGGSGLGLAICQRIVLSHGGKIEVVSTLGEGACFRFTLPLSGPDLGHLKRVHSVLEPLGKH
ncbi:MAG: HAMP domain-containing sensor histidine kinase [Mariprofundaceae bacterium]